MYTKEEYEEIINTPCLNGLTYTEWENTKDGKEAEMMYFLGTNGKTKKQDKNKFMAREFKAYKEYKNYV